jgi:tripartite-type tricarboxylate transporter receptor subunit TctC
METMMASYNRFLQLAMFLVLGAASLPTTANANFANKQITMIIGFAAGGGTDGAGRLLAQYLGKYMQGSPTIIVRNVPGASGMTSINYLLQQTAPDGMTVLMATGSQVDPINYRKVNTQFDPKAFVVVGGLASGGSVVLIANDVESRIMNKSAEPVVMGSTAALPRNAMQMTMWGIEYLGWNARWVVGYPGTNDLLTALERREIDMTATGNAFQIKKMLESGKYKIFAQSGALKAGKFVANDDFGSAPVFADLMDGKISDSLAKAAFSYWSAIMTTDKWLGLIPGTPADITNVYREAFQKLSADPEFLAAGTKIKEDLIPISHQDMTALIWNLADTPAEALDFTTSLMEKQGLRAK